MGPSYTVIFRKNAGQWVVLCLENGLLGQGETKERAAAKLHEAIASWDEAVKEQSDIYSAPISVKALHEFLTFGQEHTLPRSYELRTVYA